MKRTPLTPEQIALKQQRRKEKKRENLRRWRIANPVKALKWRRENRELINARQREYNRTHPRMSHKWQQENPEKALASCRKCRLKKRITKAAPELLSALQALLIVADHPNNPMRTGANASIIADARQAIAKATGQGGAV